MSDSFDKEFVKFFLEEALDILDSWESSCSRLESGLDEDALDELFRAAHNLKGSARAVGMQSFGQFIHEIENIITGLKNNQIPYSINLISILLDVENILRNWVEEQMKDLDHEITKSPNLVLELIDTLKSNKEPTKLDTESSVNLNFINNSENVIENFNDLAGVLPENNFTDLKGQTEKSKETINDSVRVSSEKVEELIKLIGELSISHSLVSHEAQTKLLSCSPNGHSAIILSSKLLKQVQDLAMSLRMQAVDKLFKRLERICRDISKKQDKKIKVNLEGSLVTLDKLVIEKITDPLVHVVRNAVDHGIESKEQRIASGKDPVATITISANQHTERVTITISEDGKGLDSNTIMKKAIEKGLVHPDAILSESEIHNLIFLPGFSTASEITDISGRGVGMNVVQDSIEKLSGRVEIQSELGKGTSFIINLPTSLAIIDSFIVKVSNEHIVVPLGQVKELIDINDYEIETTGRNAKMINLRGKVIPVQDLNEYIPHKSSVKSGRQLRSALISMIGVNEVAYLVDGIVGQQEVVVKELNESLSDIKHFTGGTILKNGEPGLILDLEGITRTYLKNANRKVA